jgi:peptide/nickel transport system permease protein
VLTYIVRRILYSIPVLVAASFLIFSFVALSGDPLSALRNNPRASKITIQNITEKKHLDEPLLVRYGYWVRDAVTNKFGTYLLSDRAIWPDITRVMGNTLQLIVAAEFLAVLIAIMIGVYASIRQYSLFDYGATFASFIGFSVPIFWLALILQIIFTEINNRWGVRIFYTAQLSAPDPGSGISFLVDRMQHLALPIFCLAFLGIAQFSRYMRASMLEVINSDYVRTARAKGLPERRVIMKHAFRNALIPLTTVVALDFAGLFGGAIITETIFALDGMGWYFINQLDKQDPYPIMAWLMITATIVILFNLIADIIYGILDPRIRYD